MLGSFAFYFIGAGARDTLLLSGVLLLHYALARAMAGKEVRTRKALLIIALAADLFCLVYFKYAAFILENLGKLTGTAFSLVELALPLGVSFYLFQSAGYLIDVYRGEEAEKNLIDYAAFTIAFPQLTMGPILRYREWRGALKERTITREDVFSGFELFVVGLCFKVLLADQLAPLWASLERIGYEYLSTPLAWLGAVSYSLQLYFDFSGYSLMAMGLGQMLALPVPRNFDLPYTARSVSEFYRRWHITLGTWFRDYVYIPLGGSRNGNARTVLSLTVVWFFTGLWHGASWNFVLWGVMLLGFILLEKFCIGNFLKEHKVLSHVYLLFVIPQTWVIFRITRLKDVGAYFPACSRCSAHTAPSPRRMCSSCSHPAGGCCCSPSSSVCRSRAAFMKSTAAVYSSSSRCFCSSGCACTSSPPRRATPSSIPVSKETFHVLSCLFPAAAVLCQRAGAQRLRRARPHRRISGLS